MRIEALPTEIDHPVIRQAAEKHDAAQQQLKERQRQIRDLEDGRERAEWLDAEAADAANATGKPSPKRRHVAEHEKKIDELAHEVKVAQLAVRRARGDLQAVIDEHGDEWLDGLAAQAEKLEQAFDSATAALTSLYGQRATLNTQRAKLGVDVPNVRFVHLRPGQLIDSLNGEKLAIAYDPDGGARQRRRVEVNAADVLAALSSLGVEETPVVVGSGLGEALGRSFKHKASVDRGFAPGEDNAPAMDERYLVAGGRRVSVHVGNGGED